MSGLLWEYYATPAGFEVRLFRLLLIYRLRKENIVDAHIIDGMFNFLALFRLGGHPWNTISMGNRLRRRWVLLEKRGWPRFLAITPNNPEEFVSMLVSPRRQPDVRHT
jgi:hypothetical protein